MSLQFIFGNSGSGKSEYLYQYMLEEAQKNPNVDYLLIVPEQFTMQTQRELVVRQRNHAIMNIDVLSFQRMAFRVFDELGKTDFVILEETGKNLVLRKVAQEKLEELKSLKGNIQKTGYISELKSLISELTQYHVTPEDLETIIHNPENHLTFQYKMQDVEIMYQGFLDYMAGTYITSEEVLELLADIADKSEMLKNCVLVFDGFTGFTPLQNLLLQKLFRLSKKNIVSISMDTREDFYRTPKIHELFYMSKREVGQLLEIARMTGTEVEEPVILDGGEQKRFKDAQALFFLEQNLFRKRAGTYPEQTDEVQIYSLRDPRTELTFAAKEISRLVREEKLRYRDIAIVSGDIETYGNYAEEIFAQYQIPVFLDTKKNILFHPFIEFIRSVLEMLEQQFTYESVFRYLKSSLAGIMPEEIDLLENYVLAMGIRGKKRWNQKWVKLPYQWTAQELEQVEAVRLKMMEDLSPMIEVFENREADTRAFTTVLYELIRRLQIQQQLRQYEKQFEREGNLTSAKEYAQIYGIAMSLFDKIVDLLGEEKLSVREYREILDAGFEAAKVGVIPPGHDSVLLGDIERTRLEHVKVLFFIGVNDGIIPKAEQGGGIISELERENLAKQKIELAPTGRERVFIQKFYLYLNMTKPSKRLYLTYSLVNAQGKSLRRSYLIGTILKLYPKISVREDELTNLAEIVTAESSLNYYLKGLQNTREAVKDEVFKALNQWYAKDPYWKAETDVLKDAAFYSHQNEVISKETAHALYGAILENSVTRLERFAACAFAHFMTYGLKLQERQICEFEPVDMGNIFHETIELYSKELERQQYSWFTVTPEQSDAILKKAFEQTVAEYHGEALFDNARNAYMAQRMERILKRTVWALQRQVRSGSFKPESYEVSFAFAEDLEAVNFQLSETEKMRLRGRIDRVDTLETEEKIYVKIIDYKSGNTQFQLLSMYHGLQLQLVVYLNAAMELVKKKHPNRTVEPAGVFYYHMDDPIIDAKKELSEEEIWQAVLSKLKLDGLVNGDPEVYQAMDQELSGTSNVIPISLNKDGRLSKTSKTASGAEFGIISNYVNQKIGHIGRKIMEGDISVEPYRLEQSNACSYCPYHGICGFDERMPGFECRKLEKIDSMDAIIEKMKEEV